MATENLTTVQSNTIVELVDRGMLIRSRSLAPGAVTNRTAGWLINNGFAKVDADNNLVPMAKAKKVAGKLVAA